MSLVANDGLFVTVSEYVATWSWTPRSSSPSGVGVLALSMVNAVTPVLPVVTVADAV